MRILLTLLISILLISSSSALLFERLENGNDPGDYANSINVESAQTFTIGTVGSNQSFILTSVSLFARATTVNNNLTLTIRETNSTGYPVGNNLTSLNKLYNQTNATWIAFNFTSNITLTRGTKYAIHLTFLDGNPANWQNNTNGYGGGNVFYSQDNGTTWLNQSNLDWIFRVYGNLGANISIILLSPSNNSVISSDIVNLVASANPSNGNLTNATFFLWNSTGTLIGLNRTTVTGTTTNTTNASFSGISNNGSSFKWNTLFCSRNNSGFSLCNFAASNFTFRIGSQEITNISNLTTYETESQSFFVNFSSPLALIPVSADLLYGDSSYTGTITQTSANNYNLSALIDIPIGAGSKTWLFSVTYGNGNMQNLSSHTQVVAPINLTLCSSDPQNIAYYNLSFKNETAAQQNVPAILSSSWSYWLGSGTSNKTLTFINSTENFAYTFCFSPGNKTVTTSYSLIYDNAESQQRTYAANDEEITNSTTQKILYLLPTSEGIFVTFQVINVAEQAVSGALINVTRTSDGVNVGASLTDAAGSATFFLDPDVSYTFVVTAEGYEDFTTTITPTQTSYTITLGSGASQQANDYSQGISYVIKPTDRVLNNDTTYNFNFTLSSSFWEVDSFGFILKNRTTILASTSQASNGGTVSVNLNTGDQQFIIMEYFWIIDGNYTNATTTWSVYRLTDDQFSVMRFFTDLRAYTSQGIFGLNQTSMTIIVFIIIFFITGFASFKYGITSPAAVSGILFALVAIFDVGLGMIANPVSSVTNFPTVIIGVIFISALVREALN